MSPDFIGIGTQKGATTWLHKIFQYHPNIWVPPAKELHFFDDNREESHCARIIFRRNNYKKSIKKFKFNLFKDISWSYNYLCKKRNIENYINLFRPNKGQIAGEFTPKYACLSSNKIKYIKENFPTLKVIYILRNPIQRDWSSVCMKYKNYHKADINIAPVNEIITRATKQNQIDHSTYHLNLENWETHFSSEQIFIGFFEEIQNDPQLFLEKLFNFLNLPSQDYSIFESLIERKINSYSTPISREIQTAIAKAEYDNISKIHARFDNQFSLAWLNEANLILNKTN